MTDFDIDLGRPRSSTGPERAQPESGRGSLEVGSVHDPAEREADRMAGLVTRALSSPGPLVAGGSKVQPSGRRAAGAVSESIATGRVARAATIVGTDRTADTERLSRSDRAEAQRIGTVVEEECRERLNRYVLKRLGGGGARWWRSKEVRMFRKALKQAARDQAYRDFDVAVEDLDPGGKTASRDLKELIGANAVYDDAKKTVDDVLEEITNDFVASQQNKDDFESIATTARHAAKRSFRAKPGDAKAARSAADTAIVQLEKNLKAEFRRAKDEVTGKRDQDGERTGENWAMTNVGKEISDDIVHEVEEREVGKKSLEQAIDADSMSRGLIVLGDIIDAVITGPGETLELAIEFRIPVQEGLVIIIKLEGMAARGTNGATTAGVTVLGKPERVELSAKFSVGVGADAIGLKADGTIGFFVKSGSDKGSRAALQAFSYGAYRAAPGNKFKDLWAPPDKRGDVQKQQARSATERAETWASAVEQNYFGEDDGAFAHVGMGVDGAVGINAGFAEFGIGFGDSVFAKYDRDSLTADGSLGNRFGASLGDKASEREAMALERRKNAKAGTGFSAYMSAAMKIGAGDHEFEVSVAGSGAHGPKANWGIDITLAVSSPADAAAPGVADRLVNDFLGAITPVMQKIQSGIHADPKKANMFGKLAQLPADGAQLIDFATKRGLSDAIKDIHEHTVEEGGTDIELGGSTIDPKTGETLTKPEEVFGVSNQMVLFVTFGQNENEGVFRVELRNKRGLSIGNSVTLAKFTGAKTTRLFAGGKDADGGVWEVGGRRYDHTND